MINIEEMKKCAGHNIKVTDIDGQIFEGYCTEYLWPEDDDEKHNITIQRAERDYVEINQDEILKIEYVD